VGALSPVENGVDTVVYHYPPELLALLIDTIPLLCRSKKDVLVFFRGAGVPPSFLADLSRKLKSAPETVNKFEIARSVLQRVNEAGDSELRTRREILKRVVDWEDFSVCWPNDILKAKGLVAEIRRVINVKDSFTRMSIERENERKQRQAEYARKIEAKQRLDEQVDALRIEMNSLFSMSDPQKRGKRLESVLNRMFQLSGLLIREAFCLSGDAGEGVYEQIDGVVEVDGSIYLVEMKWHNHPLGRADVAEHLIRIFSRGNARGILISATGYTEPAIAVCKESLSKATVVLCTLEEIVMLLERRAQLADWLRTKIQAAIVDRNPFVRV
jgi:restriction system protein